jgi:hypothetical protein
VISEVAEELDANLKAHPWEIRTLAQWYSTIGAESVVAET